MNATAETPDHPELKAAQAIDLDLLIDLLSNVEKPKPEAVAVLRLAVRCKHAESFLSGLEAKEATNGN